MEGSDVRKIAKTFQKGKSNHESQEGYFIIVTHASFHKLLGTHVSLFRGIFDKPLRLARLAQG